MGEGSNWTDPLHIQQLDKFLRLDPFLNEVEKLVVKEDEGGKAAFADLENDHHIPEPEGLQQKKGFLNPWLYSEDRQWLVDVVLDDTSSSDNNEVDELTEERLHNMLVEYAQEKRVCRTTQKQHKSMLYFGSGLISTQDNFNVKAKELSASYQLKTPPLKRKYERKTKEKPKSSDESECEEETKDYVEFRSLVLPNKGCGRASKKKLSEEKKTAKRHKLWVAIAKKEIPKAQKMKTNSRKEMLMLLKKVAKESQKESRKKAMASQKMARDAPARAKRLCREMQVYWKRFEKVERDHRKKAEKEAYEQRRQDLETLEMKRQQRKLNFLITQTELYAHFMARKMAGNEEATKEEILCRLSEQTTQQVVEKNGLVDLVGDSYNASKAQQQVVANATAAFEAQQRHQAQFDQALANPALSTEVERPQPALMEGLLKSYQLKGMNWLVNLYDQGINGILADEMGLGKTVQSIAFLGHLAETYNIWGPYLVVAPASTLHNWQQEVTRFLPSFKVVPYWGNLQDRKVLRLFWNQSNSCSQNSSFHVLITSYQIVIQDFKYFSRVKWHYMILDEAQAIKSTSSTRWKILLGFNCRNRLLLTGTPIQNTMQELWALLHFIMPTLFDSHEEFSEWFSKDIETSVERQSAIDERHLSRLHMILKPFMLRRLKKDVQDELSDKIERLVPCVLTTRQKMLYQAVKNKIRIEDLLQTGGSDGSSGGNQASSLMNLVMQFRKVCNHPELFERKEIRSPLFLELPKYHISKLLYREGIIDTSVPSSRHLLFNRFYIHRPDYVHESLSSSSSNNTHLHSCFSFLRFIARSPMEWYSLMLKGFVVRWLDLLQRHEQMLRTYHSHFWRCEDSPSPTNLLLTPLHTTVYPSVQSSHYLKELVFTSSISTVHSHLPWHLHYIPETTAHRKVRLKHLSEQHQSPTPAATSTPTSPTKRHRRMSGGLSPSSPPGFIGGFSKVKDTYEHIPREPKTLPLMLTDMPRFLYHLMPKIRAPAVLTHCSDRSARWSELDRLAGGEEGQCLAYGSPQGIQELRADQTRLFPDPPRGLAAVQPHYGFSGVYIPDKETLITDAGKLHMLDILLAQLKCEGHRVLIYSQMTRMIDILEEYMWYRRHTYMRLDGSSKISARRDMVANFQTRSDIFVFLLSTRAGGLGINLTAADTVIFYDSDWNPTVDQQAMDRAHRLGQTKQVTVYRLICTGTIEERILQRAREKSEIQKMVISGGNYRPDVLRPKEVVSLLLDDDEMENKFKQKEAERTHTRGIFGVSVKRKTANQTSKSPRGPGRPKKRKFQEDENFTYPAADEAVASRSMTPSESVTREATPCYTPILDESVHSVDSPSVGPSSPVSLASQVESDYTAASLADDSLTDYPLVVDDKTPSQGSQCTTPQGQGRRARGRPRGSGGRRPRARGSIQKALSAAEAAAMQAGKSAGYAAYGYSLSGPNGEINISASSQAPVPLYPRGRGRGRGRWKHRAL